MVTTSASVILLALAASVIPTSAATASDSDSQRGFPPLAIQWYFTQPAVEYESAPPYGQVDESLKMVGLNASYFLPTGGPPGRGQGDISIDRFPDEDRLSDEVQIDFDAFEALQSDLGATFVDGVPLPSVEGVADPLGYQFSDSVLTVTRSSIGCGRSDTRSPYESQVALLGSNGSKYLVDLSLDFGDRPPCLESIDGAREDATPSPAPMPASSERPVEHLGTSADGPGQAPAPAREPVSQPSSEVGASEEKASAAVAEVQKWDVPKLVIAGALLLILFFLMKLLPSRRRRKQFKADGTIANPQSGHSRGPTSRANENTLETIDD
jgi:hypothetical protein